MYNFEHFVWRESNIQMFKCFCTLNVTYVFETNIQIFKCFIRNKDLRLCISSVNSDYKTPILKANFKGISH